MSTNDSITKLGLDEDFDLQLSRGEIYNHTCVNKFGRNQDVTAAATEEVWDGSVAYTYPTGADITRINTTADVAGMRGEVVEIQGLDANWELVVQNATLDASNTTTLVVLTTPLIRVFRMKFLSAVVGTSSITLVNDADNVLYANIEPGFNQTQMAIYTVPDGFSAYMTNYYAHHNPKAGQQFTSNPIQVWSRDNKNGYAPQLKHAVGVAEDGGFQHFFHPYLAFTERSDVYVTSSPVAADADISAGFDLIVVKN